MGEETDERLRKSYWWNEIRFRFWQLIKCIKISLVSEFPDGTIIKDIPVLENIRILIEIRIVFGTIKIGLC